MHVITLKFACLLAQFLVKNSQLFSWGASDCKDLAQVGSMRISLHSKDIENR